MKKIRDLNPKHGLPCFGRDNRIYIEFKNLMLNSIKINGVDFPSEIFIKNELIENGAVGYDSITKKWAKVKGQGINEIGNPTELTFVLRNGKSFTRPACYVPDETGAFRILATPTGLAVGDLIFSETEFLFDCENAIKQNVKATKTPKIVTCKNEDLRLSLNTVVEQTEEGKPYIIVSDELGESLKVTDTSVPYVADKIEEIKGIHRDLLINKLGILSANINKKERVQVGEVNATVGQCSDYIYLIIDTFNKQMESYGLPFYMEFNGSLEELYENSDNEEIENDKQSENFGKIEKTEM